SDEDISAVLARQGSAAGQDARLLPLAQGSLQRALMFAGSDFVSRREKIAACLGEGAAAALKMADDLARDEELLPLVLEFLESWYRDMLVLLEGAHDARLYNADLADGLAAAAGRETRDSVIEKIKKLRRLQTGAAFNPDMQLGLEAVLLH
ncbi:MAG: hypothetical protein NTX06_13820, partial [Proteobacteria bacterium]|nr:hypothetical protein [Pseudomonadota bacterium]